MQVRVNEDGTYFYVLEPDQGRHAPESMRLCTNDGRIVTRRRHGQAARVEVLDESGAELPAATLLRAAAAAGRALEKRPDALGRTLRVRLRGSGPAELVREGDGRDALLLDGRAVRDAPVHHPVEGLVARALESLPPLVLALPPAGLPERPARGVLFFESLMNSDMPHNDCELSQGVLHMASALRAVGSEVVLANVKMAMVGAERPVSGLERLPEVLAGHPVDLVCITLLEGYFEGVVGLVSELRRLGCRAHVAVGGVMPTLTPEHVAAHLPDVSFVCRGAGEYFVPRLAEIVGNHGIDQPLSAGQRSALLSMDGVIALDRAGRALVSGNSARTVSVDSLDRVPLDLGLLQARHLERGVELSTSRGCVHKCAFCSIIGRQSYQARSADGVLALLRDYQARYRELFGHEIPQSAFRLHISDDDFACDRARAAQFFRGLLETPFRLASVQVSVADLCRKRGTELLAEPDSALLDALRADCFADQGAAIPERDFVADHRSRRWSAYLQIGVETFSDRELARLGKGYRVAHVRAVVDELARRRIHVDAYLILANSETTADDLVDSVEELCRLKLRHPRWFHVRFPIVPRLVSYFPSASHRRMLRRGQLDRMSLRARAEVAGHPELDYPFVAEDVPHDAWVREVDASVFTDRGFYTATLQALRDKLGAHVADVPGACAPEHERLLRRLDDLPRRLGFAMLKEAQQAAQAAGRAERERGPGRSNPSRAAPSERLAIDTATELLGPKETWLPAYRRFASEAPARLVVIPTWQCELRCVYCWIPKQDGRVMTSFTLERSIDLALSTERERMTLQFFGGEALTQYPLVQHGIEYAEQRASEVGKQIDFILSSNGWSIDEQKLAWLAAHPVKLELSLDGAPDVQNLARPARERGQDSYLNGIGARARAIHASGVPSEVIMVVVPRTVDRVPESFFHIADLGFRRIQINFALGVMWSRKHQESFARGLDRIGKELRVRAARGEELVFVNLEEPPLPVRLNGEITVDWDGTVYAGNGFLHETENKSKFVIGHLDDRRSFDRYWLDAKTNDFLLEHSYPPEVTANNRAVGAILTSFIRFMQSEAPSGRDPGFGAANPPPPAIDP